MPRGLKITIESDEHAARLIVEEAARLGISVDAFVRIEYWKKSAILRAAANHLAESNKREKRANQEQAG